MSGARPSAPGLHTLQTDRRCLRPAASEPPHRSVPRQPYCQGTRSAGTDRRCCKRKRNKLRRPGAACPDHTASIRFRRGLQSRRLQHNLYSARQKTASAALRKAPAYRAHTQAPSDGPHLPQSCAGARDRPAPPPLIPVHIQTAPRNRSAIQTSRFRSAALSASAQ